MDPPASSEHEPSYGRRTEGARSLMTLPLAEAAKATLLSAVVAFPPAPMAPAASPCELEACLLAVMTMQRSLVRCNGSLEVHTSKQLQTETTRRQVLYWSSTVACGSLRSMPWQLYRPNPRLEHCVMRLEEWRSAVQCSEVKCSAVQCSAVQCSGHVSQVQSRGPSSIQIIVACDHLTSLHACRGPHLAHWRSAHEPIPALSTRQRS